LGLGVRSQLTEFGHRTSDFVIVIVIVIVIEPFEGLNVGRFASSRFADSQSVES